MIFFKRSVEIQSKIDHFVVPELLEVFCSRLIFDIAGHLVKETDLMVLFQEKLVINSFQLNYRN